MTKRGKKSRVTIAGHTLTFAELAVLRQLQEYVQVKTYAFVTGGTALAAIFPDANAKRYCARHLAKVGVLAACGLELLDDVVRLKGQTP
jgi:hypothetical protein